MRLRQHITQANIPVPKQNANAYALAHTYAHSSTRPFLGRTTPRPMTERRYAHRKHEPRRVRTMLLRLSVPKLALKHMNEYLSLRFSTNIRLCSMLSRRRYFGVCGEILPVEVESVARLE